MITTQELRVGNIVDWHGNNISISCVDETQDTLKFSTEFEGWSEINLLGIEPVELSEEILFKVGFEKEISNDDEERLMYSIQISNNTSLYFDRHKDLVRSDIYIEWYLSHEWNNNHFKNELGWNNPKHLHQLQNLYFALTGEELDVSKLI